MNADGRRRRSIALAGAAIGILALASAAASCTVFNGLEADPDAGSGSTPWAAPELAYLELDAAVRLCRWVLECDRLSESIATSIAVPLDAQNFSQCLHWAAGPLPPDRPGLDEQRALLTALSSATSCEDALSRTYVEVIHAASDPRCDGALTHKCDAELLAIDCVVGTVTRCDSPRFDPDTHSCVLGFCVYDDCAMSTEPVFTCTDEVTTVCSQTLQAGIACTPLGLTCALGVTCGPDDSTVLTCDVIGEVSCQAGDPDVVEICNGLVAAEYRCDQLEGGTCASDLPRCTLPTAVCSPLDSGQNACNGSKLTACVAGQHIEVDCAAAELECVAPAAEKSGRCGKP